MEQVKSPGYLVTISWGSFFSNSDLKKKLGKSMNMFLILTKLWYTMLSGSVVVFSKVEKNELWAVTGNFTYLLSDISCHLFWYKCSTVP